MATNELKEERRGGGGGQDSPLRASADALLVSVALRNY